METCWQIQTNKEHDETLVLAVLCLYITFTCLTYLYVALLYNKLFLSLFLCLFLPSFPSLYIILTSSAYSL